jgi:hypothetical protein
MQLGVGAVRAGVRRVLPPKLIVAALCAIALAACTLEERPVISSPMQPQGATVAFESIDGPPPGAFHRLVQDLNSEAQARRLAVVSRETPSAYRVRGYLSATKDKGKVTIGWVWDVFDGEQHRALRLDGAEIAEGNHRDAWAAADDAMLGRIAASSMDQLAAFLTSPEAAPGVATASSDNQSSLFTLAGLRKFSPEASGIFRIFQAHADPVATEKAEPAEAESLIFDTVPLPRRRPPLPGAVSAHETLTLAAASHRTNPLFTAP